MGTICPWQSIVQLTTAQFRTDANNSRLYEKSSVSCAVRFFVTKSLVAVDILPAPGKWSDSRVPFIIFGIMQEGAG